MRLEIFQLEDQLTLTMVDKRIGKDVVMNLSTREIQHLRDFLSEVLRDTGVEWSFPEG